MLRRVIDVLFVVFLLALLAVPVVYHRILPVDTRMTLDEFAPRTHLNVAETGVERARFPVFASGARLDGEAGRSAAAAVIEACNVETVLGGDARRMRGERLGRELERDRAPGAPRVRWATSVGLGAIDRDDFAERAVTQLEQDVEAGARALMVSRELGLGARDGRGRLLGIDDERLDPIWKRCGELGIPVILESLAPTAYWQPVDAHNERYRELMGRPVEGRGRWTSRGPAIQTVTGVHPKLQVMRNPELLHYFTFHWSGDFYPRKAELAMQRDRVVERHPATTFIAVGIAGYPEDLAFVSRELERFDNLYVDLAGAYAELGRQPYRARAFLVEHADRVLFAVEGPPSVEAYRTAFRFLESRDEYFDPPAIPGRPTVLWKIYGMGLPDAVLQKIYRENARRLFGDA